MTRRRIYLHVGCRKSGTSFLQKSIWDGQARLEAEGLGFPLIGRGEHVQTLLDPLSAVQPGGQVPPRAVRAMRKLRARIEETDADKVLLTLEDLAQLPRHQIEPLMEALAGDEVHVVITARSWAKQIPSEWQQRLKERYTVPYLDFARAVSEGSSPDAALFRSRHDVPDVAGRWGAQLPPEHVHVVAVPPSSSDPTALFRLFASVVDVDPDAFVMPQVGRNPSLGYAQAETLRRINVALGDRLTDIRGEYRYVVRMYLATRVLAKQPGDKIPLPPELVGWCHETSAAAAKRIVDAGYDVVGALDDLVSSPDPARAEPVPALSEADIAETAVTALAEVACLRDRERRQAQAGTAPTAHPAGGRPLVTVALARARRAVAALRR